MFFVCAVDMSSLVYVVCVLWVWCIVYGVCAASVVSSDLCVLGFVF